MGLDPAPYCAVVGSGGGVAHGNVQAMMFGLCSFLLAVWASSGIRSPLPIFSSAATCPVAAHFFSFLALQTLWQVRSVWRVSLQSLHKK
jgi:hypothetical protein